jgi:hypothetical protein
MEPHLGWVRKTAVGPALHFLLPSCGSVAVGRLMEGPTPQMTLPVFTGDRNSE